MFANSGDIIPPCGVPLAGMMVVPFSNWIGAFKIRVYYWTQSFGIIDIQYIALDRQQKEDG